MRFIRTFCWVGAVFSLLLLLGGGVFFSACQQRACRTSAECGGFQCLKESALCSGVGSCSGNAECDAERGYICGNVRCDCNLDDPNADCANCPVDKDGKPTQCQKNCKSCICDFNNKNAPCRTACFEDSDCERLKKNGILEKDKTYTCAEPEEGAKVKTKSCKCDDCDDGGDELGEDELGGDEFGFDEDFDAGGE